MNDENFVPEIEQEKSPLRGLINDFRDGVLDLSPPYQRGFVWNDAQKSAFIESFWVELPLNAITIRIKDEFYNAEVVDGKQRLSTLISYVNDEFIPTNMKLYQNKKVFTKHFNGLKFSSLDMVFQRDFLTKTILKTFIKKDATDEFVKMIYNRLNFGGTPHLESERA